MRTFTCKQFGCKVTSYDGIPAAMCIKRQYARTPGEGGSTYGEMYLWCRDCPQGAVVAAFHPHLIPEGKKPGTIQNRICLACGDPFHPDTPNQKHCTRTCGHVTRSSNIRNTPSSPFPNAGAHGSIPPDKELEVAPKGPGKLAEVDA